jgi:predicted glycogen debranching enzyme
MNLGPQDCQNLERSLSLEWLETNGRGGFASGTVAGPNTRRYHALLLVARNPPVDRLVLVNHLEEHVEIDGRFVPISANLYPGATHPDGYRRCVGFSSEPWPTWTYDCEGIQLAREILYLYERDAVVVRWCLLNPAAGPVRLRIRPMLTGREYHALHHENGTLRAAAQAGDGWVAWQPYRDLPTVRAFHHGTYRHEPDWYRRVQYPVEQERGLDFEEDWWSPGEITLDLSADRGGDVVLTTERPDRLDADALVARERRRREHLADGSPADPLVSALWRASEAYLSVREQGKTVIAGYPWFTDWGRDTFLSLPGLCLVTGRHEVARQVIEAFARHVSQGMIPNRFPDAGETLEYNTVDASLWFVQAVGRYLAYTGEMDTIEKVAWPAVRAILDGYRQGTRYGIKVDQDGLVAAGVPGFQLTWMDAKVGDWVVTPRRGKPVEIQALWIHALAIGAALAVRFGDRDYAARCASAHAQAVASFRKRFWYEAGGHLYDVVDGEEGDDSTFRPNQLYAIALCDDLLEPDRAQQVVQAVADRLLTPVGLRTLAPGDPRYRPRYEGGVAERDGAYHQGTVWPFLLGPFVTAWIKVHGGSDEARREARTFFDGIERHLAEACLGQVSEVFDAEPPHRPKGCFAQAWSVAEVLRALVEDVLGKTPDAKEAAMPYERLEPARRQRAGRRR